MNKLAEYKKFKYNGSYKREKEDFTYTIFKDYDFSKEIQNTSFFRSDFRGAQFENIIFYKNNFDRADFISATFINTLFSFVHIASCEMKNCYFENSTFSNNFYNNTSIQECVFKDCIFEDENFLINMKNCQFINCQLKNVKFERSTTESLSFNLCNIFNVDFANMHAERYRFISCNLQDVQIDVCYIYGYLFYDTNLFNIKIIYMGDLVDFNEDNVLYKFASNLWARSRYYEFINAYIIFGHTDNVKPLLEKAFIEMSKTNTYQRNLEIYNILDMLQFYISKNIFCFSSTKSIIEYLECIDLSTFTFEEKTTYLSQLEKIKTYLSDAQYNMDFILSAKNDVSFVTFYCKSDNYEQAINTVKDILEQAYAMLGVETHYILFDAQQGSWILTFVVISSCALLLPKIIKASTNLFFEINTKRKISKRISDKLEKKTLSTSELKELAEIAATAGIVNSGIKEINSKDLSEFIDLIKIGI